MRTIHWIILDENEQVIMKLEYLSEEMKVNIVAKNWKAYQLIHDMTLLDSCESLRILDMLKP